MTQSNQVLDFIDFIASSRTEAGYSTEMLDRAIKFYKTPFSIKAVLQLFEGWSQAENDPIDIVNHHSNGEWSTVIQFHYNSYTLDGTNYEYLPETIGTFISDCLRYEDIDLRFSKMGIKELYGE